MAAIVFWQIVCYNETNRDNSKREPEFAVVSMELITERCMIRNMKMEDANDLYQVLSQTACSVVK